MTTEEKNFVRLTYIIVNILTKHLRTLFIKKWNDNYEKWRSDKASGGQLWELSGESFRKSNNDCKEKIQTGNEKQWDTAILCKIFLFSDLKLIGGGNPKYAAIGKIRSIRNKYFAHPKNMSCQDDEFNETVAEIKSAAKLLFKGDVEHEISVIEKSPIDQEMVKQSRIGKRFSITLFFYAPSEIEVF